MNRTAVVAGASGLVGNRCLQVLLETPEYAEIIAAASISITQSR